jgi:hypothetical protein
MKRVLAVVFTLAVAGVALGDEEKLLKHEPLPGKRSLAPIRGRRLGPHRPDTNRNRPEPTETKVHRRERPERRQRTDGPGSGMVGGLDILDFDEE